MRNFVRSQSFFSAALGLSAIVLFVMLGTSVTSGQAPTPAPAGQVTFSKDVAPILYKSCVRAMSR